MSELSEHNQELVRWIRRTRPVVYTTLTHVSSSGMLRVIDCFAIRGKVPVSLNQLIEALGLYKQDKRRNGVRAGGCGMNMGFAIVYALGSAVFPNGFKYRKNEHHRNNDPAPKDADGGYALSQQWK